MSSLRVQATATGRRHSHRLRRVIPACAGNSYSALFEHRIATGHPCVCGERQTASAVGRIVVGSSLRAQEADRFTW